MVKSFDKERNICIAPWGQEFHFSELGRLLPHDFLFQKYHFAEKVKALDLSLPEEAVIRAILLTCTGNA